jgi:hypothetical protein
VAVADGGDPGASRCRHRAVFVNGSRYDGMRDTDVRGFLDGGFNWGWNQSGQGKIRIGREEPRILPPRYGEDELFRTLMRWDGVELPEGAGVTDARIRLTVLRCPGERRELFLYAMRRDWRPGSGGVDGNNVSVPGPGEVWWREASHRRESWALPGAGHAAATDDADVVPVPLAHATYRPGDEATVFASAPLADYAADRIARDEPLLFLLKMSDLEEDAPGDLLEFYSGDHGWTGRPDQRPRLELEWELPDGWTCRQVPLLLEYGRRLPLDLPEAVEDRRCSLWFESDGGGVAPCVELPPADDGRGRRWLPLVGAPPTELSAESSREAILLGADRPVALGAAFEAEMHETWVVSGPAEDQEVKWSFWSPDGERHDRLARYRGGFRWRVEFRPDVPGPWRFRWQHDLHGKPYRSPVGHFDVVAADGDAVGRALGELATGLDAGPESRPGRDRELRSRLMRLERAGVALLSPGEFRSEPGEALKAEIRRVRSALWGRPVPEKIPMVSHRLRTRMEGRELSDPIPDFAAAGHDEGGPSAARRAVRLLRKTRRRLKAGLDGFRRLWEGRTLREPDQGEEIHEWKPGR